MLGEIDQAVEFGRKHDVHVCLNLHRAPGYTVAKPPEKLDLWTDEEAQKQFDFQWSSFARRYRGIPSKQAQLQPCERAGQRCGRGVRQGGPPRDAAIRREDPERLIIADGLRMGPRARRSNWPTWASPRALAATPDAV